MRCGAARARDWKPHPNKGVTYGGGALEPTHPPARPAQITLEETYLPAEEEKRKRKSNLRTDPTGDEVMGEQLDPVHVRML